MRRKCDQRLALAPQHGIGRDEQRRGALAHEGRERRVEIPAVAHAQNEYLVPERSPHFRRIPLLVEVHTGADGNIAAEMVAKSAPDGYTWLSTSVPFTTQAALQPGKLRYDPVRDFAPVANLGTAPFVLVVPDGVPASTLKEFIAYAKARPPARCHMRGRRSDR